MERITLGSTVGVTKTYKDGTAVNVERLDLARPVPGEVAEHEAAHVVAAGKIVSATIIPSGNALGATQPVEMTAAAAAAADALGYNGTSWDMYLAQYVLGVAPSVARSAAHSALAGRQEEMHEVAIILEERKTIGQSDVEEARQNVKDRKNGKFPIQIEIIDPFGERKIIKTKTSGGEIKIYELGQLQKAA